MPQFNISSTPYKQFPIRLSHELTNRLNQTAKSTRINKTTLGRIAIRSLLDDIDLKGIATVLKELENI
jgi:predicted DNA-binding protein